ncbi:histidine kinase [Mucilaginibacter sp. CSA2-8R]|uniref:sensor histidine kinase n=1 Tax=Mucilaginibacter sp. CSA2-8R TaxID=3141542 RepID=UPI00315D32C6
MNKLIGKPWVYNSIPALVWFLLLVLPFLTGRPANIPATAHHRFLINVVSTNFLLLCVFYLHTYLLYPILKRKGLAWYIVSLVLMLGVYGLCWWLITGVFHHPDAARHLPDLTRAGQNGARNGRHFGPPGGGGPRPFSAVLSVLIALLCSYCYKMILDNANREQLLKERETIHLKTELNFLRSQISPHFMFNVLNNLVALARKKSDTLEPAIINLSQIMRYMLYESDDNQVLLSKEIEYLKSYINLQMLRFGSEVTVKVNVTGNADMFMIEPMLLIPFVENAFKHGTGMLENPVILIGLNVDETKRQLQFRVTNSISPLDVSKDKSSGIGLSNVNRRLAILYPGKHQLNVFNKDNSFTAELILNLA